MSSLDLDERYGRRPRRPGSSRRRPWATITAVGILVAGVVAFWAGTSLNRQATVEAQIAGFSQSAPHEVAIMARVSALPGTPVACAFEASSVTSSTVGYKVVLVPASDDAHQSVQVTLRTTLPVDSVAVRDCWVTSR